MPITTSILMVVQEWASGAVEVIFVQALANSSKTLFSIVRGIHASNAQPMTVPMGPVAIGPVSDGICPLSRRHDS
jgi:hypothetical protein